MDPTIDLGNEEGAHASAVAKVAKYRIFVAKYHVGRNEEMSEKYVNSRT